MDITFLQARMALQKRFDDQGKHSYPNAYEFTSHTIPITTLKEFHYMVTQQAAQGNCLLKGHVTRTLDNESRAGSTDRDMVTQWLCLDADGITGIENANTFLKKLGLDSYSYVLQLSSSAFLAKDGVTNTDFNAHVFLFLDKPVSPHQLKLWF